MLQKIERCKVVGTEFTATDKTQPEGNKRREWQGNGKETKILTQGKTGI